MNRSKYIFALLLFFCFTAQAYSQALIADIIKAAVVKVIRAVDLKIQRLQNKTVDLQNIQKEIENKLSKLKLDEISEWTRKQKEIYQEYFDELWRVKSAIAYYKRITEILQLQKKLVADYKNAWALIQQDKNFSAKELQYIYGVYSGIISESIKSLDQILMVAQSFTVQMSDADRLEILNRAADEIERSSDDLKSFTNENIGISLRRSRDLAELQSIKRLYGLPE